LFCLSNLKNGFFQWRSINNGNWKAIENIVFRSGQEGQEVGQIGVMTIADREIYLSVDKVPVARWIYKISGEQVFITYNNVYGDVNAIKTEMRETFGDKTLPIPRDLLPKNSKIDFGNVQKGLSFMMKKEDFANYRNEL
jgi:hypothetical protein